jgi:anti-sigma28 factor (negative regulator of flagellin synthesis)
MRNRQLNYLNAILTVNAVLLAVLIWTQAAPMPVEAQSAHAQSTSAPRRGIPNAAEQRQKMIAAMQDMKKSVDGLRNSIESGKVKVEVTNLDEIEINVERDRR